MRLVRTGRGDEVRVHFDVRRCTACGQGFDRLGTYRPTLTTCMTHRDGHWTLSCRNCGHVEHDTVCDRPAEHHPLEGHTRVPSWDEVQHGPSLDLS